MQERMCYTYYQNGKEVERQYKENLKRKLKNNIVKYRTDVEY